MSNLIRPQPGILEIAPYVGGKANVAGVANAVKLSSNENPFGASEKAREAYLRAVHSLHRYPNTDHAELREAIAEVHGLDASRVICGVGSDEIIQLLAQGYAGPRDEVVFTKAALAEFLGAPASDREAGQ